MVSVAIGVGLLVCLWLGRKALKSIFRSSEEYAILVEKEARIDLRRRGYSLQKKAEGVKDYPLPSEVNI